MNRTVKKSFAVLAGAVGLVLSAGSAFAATPVRIGSARTVEDGTRFALRFAAAHEGVTRDIYALYGAADHRDDTNGWDHVELLATVPNTAEAASVTVSPTLTAETPCLRFLVVPRTAYSSLSYSQTDLAAQWDGIENAGHGLHACSTNYWTDLSGNGWDVMSSYPDYWTPNAYAFTRSAVCAFWTPTTGFLGSLGTNWTVEVFVRPAKGNDVNHAGICGGHGNKGGLIMAQWASGNYWVGNEVSIGRNVSNTELTSKNLHHLAFSMDATTLKARVFLDGVTLSEPAFSAGQSALSYSWFRIGNAYDGSAGRTFQGDIHAVRVYKRVLSEDELKQHGEIDAVRFSAGGGLSDMFSPADIKPSMSIARANRDGSGKVTSFTLNLYGAFKTDDEIYAAYGASDGGLATGLWERVELVGTASAGEAQVTVPAPADFGDELACIRFFRPAETGDGFSSADYVRNGLQAFWDGRDNIGVDDHDATSTEWVDLSGHGWTLTSSGSGGWTDCSYRFTRNSTPCFSCTTGVMPSLGASWTFEGYVKPDSSNFGNYAGLAGKHRGGNPYDGMVFWQYVNGTFGVGPTSFTTAGVPASGLTANESHQLVMTADADSSAYAIYVDGRTATSGTFAAGKSVFTEPDFIIGNAYDGSYARNFSGDVYSFRLYNRALTEEELAHNRIVDQIRAGDVPSQLATELFRLSVEVNLEIAADSDVAGPVAPDYGSYPDIVSQLPFDCTATHLYTNSATLYECYGYTLDEAGAASVTNDARRLTFDADHSGNWTLTWRWRPIAYAVVGSTYGASATTRVVDVNADPDYGLFHAAGSTTTVRAVSDTDQQVFDHWEGDVPAALARQAEIELTMDAEKHVTAVFRPTYWLFDSQTMRISDGQSSIPVDLDGNRLTTHYVHNGVTVSPHEVDFRLPIRDAEGNPYTLVSIGDSTFVRLTFDRIFLPDTIEVIDYQAFYQCGVKCIQPFLPKSVRCIQPNAFVYCGVTNDLTVLAKRPVDMPETWNGQLAGSQFSQCGGISCITFGRGVTNIPPYLINANMVAGYLTNVTCYGELKTVGEMAFSYQKSLHDFRLNGFPLISSSLLTGIPQRTVRFFVPKGDARWSAYLADPEKVQPWAEVDSGYKTTYFSRFGADAEPPFGRTLETTDHMLGDQWIARWNPGAIGTRIIFR